MTLAPSQDEVLPVPPRIDLRVRRPPADRAYRAVIRGIGLIVLAAMVLVFFFLANKAWPFLKAEGLWKFLTTQNWNPAALQAGVGSLLFQTVLLAVVALVIALPVSITTALFITEYAPRSLRGPMTSLVDLLAAVPSIIFGA